MQTIQSIAKKEESISKFINIIGHYDHDTLIDKSGKLIQIIKLQGLDYLTKDEVTLNTFKERRNNLLKSFSSDFAFYFWEIRRKCNDVELNGKFEGYADYVNQSYLDKLNVRKLYRSELYMAIMTKPAEGLINKGFGFLYHVTRAFDKSAKDNFLKKQFHELRNATQKVLSTLADYGCELLSVYEHQTNLFSKPMEFIGQLINFDGFRVPFVIKDSGRLLGRKRISFNGRAGTIEMRAADGSKKFAAMLSIKAYSPLTYQGILDELSLLFCEFVITQSYRFFDRQIAKTKLRDQQSDMMQSKDESIRQTDEIDEAFDDAASGDVGYGLHHFSITCYTDSQEELQQQVSTIVARFSDLDIACVREDIACECSFWAQLPGNFGFVLRHATISTKNMAGFASLHSYPLGKALGNHWGEAVSVLETISGSPYYFNFHYRDVGNFLVFGAMGSGKTVLVGFLLLQSMKFGGKRVIFDKDRGLEILVRAMGGSYERIKPGTPTGFNPCKLSDTEENRHFLFELFKKIVFNVGEQPSESELDIIKNVISGLYRLPLEDRRFCHLASFFGAKKSGSLRHRFDQWHSEGPYAWVFDNERDSLSLNKQVLGFDLSHILSDDVCKTPTLMYLTHRVEQALQGERGILFCDEGWKVLNDEYFKNLINDWSRTPRKKDNIFGLATQVANDTIEGNLSKAINESAFCKIFFPNSAADRAIYMDQYGLTEREYELIKTLPDDQHYFLLIHGRNQDKQSVVLRVNLKGLEDLIAVISARESTLLLLDQIRQEVGDDPKVWLPLFHQRRQGI